jgi:hypothetical protein
MHARIRAVLDQRERSESWLARKLGISPNYLWRIFLGPDHPQGRALPEWFYTRVSALLDVPEDMLRTEPKEPVAA